MVTAQRSQLTLSGVTYEDAGMYRCRAVNKVVGDVQYSGSARLEIKGQ